MPTLSNEQILLVLVALAVILAIGRGSAEVARRVGQPEVLGELIGGCLLGPSVLGALLPGVRHELFLHEPVGLSLSAFSWVGAVLLLFIAGLEVDLDILRAEAKPGALATLFAMVPSLAVGTAFGLIVLHRSFAASTFLGVVLSVTAVSVAAKILMERDTLRRGYAQVILAAGVASEVVVWLLVSIVASFGNGSPLRAGLQSFVFAVLFFVVMMTVGRRFTFWAMRRVADLSGLINGQLSLVLILVFLSAALTHWLGLHALLGAFVFGVLLSRSPRATISLKENVQALTVGVFGPVFFVLAGMRVDVSKLGHVSQVGTMLLLFVVATTVKIGGSALGAKLGGQGGWAPALVGVGLNLKGGTDVIVAIVGAQLGLISNQTYAMYTVVAILTVLVSPPLMTFLEARVPPSAEEKARLKREEAKRRAYLPTIERVLVPVVPALLPAAAASVVETIARAKREEDEFFDITKLSLNNAPNSSDAEQSEVDRAHGALQEASAGTATEVTERKASPEEALTTILAATKKQNALVAIGAQLGEQSGRMSLGDLQDLLIDQVSGDVLVAMLNGETKLPPIKRILVPVNGLEYTLDAADVAAYLAKATNADLTLFTVVRARLDPRFWREREHSRTLESGFRILREARFRTDRLGIRVRQRVVAGDDLGAALSQQLHEGNYDLLVLGAIDRGGDDHIDLGPRVESVLTRRQIPTVLLVTHERPTGRPAAA
jgi:Kef-type K+ transport system membrane component KefB/nucleotide-binding universal stress UspA family protein